MGRQRKRDNSWGNREDHREWTRLAFDYYKQLATLSGVGAAVVLAIYEQEILDKEFLQFALVEFALAGAACVLGMTRLLAWFPYPRSKDEKPSTPLLAQIATNLVVIAVFTLVFSTIELPDWIIYVVISAYVLLFILIFWGDKVVGKIARWMKANVAPWLRDHVASRLPQRVQRSLRRRFRS